MGQIPVFHANAVGGRLEFSDDAKRLMRQWLGTLDGTLVDVTVQPHRKHRSIEQNAWIWGVAYPVIAEAIGYDLHEHDDLHYALIAKCFGEHFDKRVGAMVPNKRSSKLTTREFSEYMEWLVRFAATDLGGIVVPLPNESEAA